MTVIRTEQTDAIDAVIEQMMAELGVPGAALGIVQNGELAYAKGYGVTEVGTDNAVTPQTLFSTASNAKTLTASAIMQLVEQGNIDLDEPVTTYLPYFQMADERYKAITIRHLLAHRSGLRDSDWLAPGYYTNPISDEDDGALERTIRGLSDDDLLNAPGEAFNYSASGYDVLGDVIAQVSGQSYEAYVREHILDPLGMHQSAQLLADLDLEMLAKPHILDADGTVIVNPVLPYKREEGPDTHFFTSVEEMARYAVAHLDHENASAVSLLAPASYNDLWSKVSDTPFPPPDSGYGLGWMIGDHKGHPVIGHGGIDIGYNAFLSLLPDDQMAVILMTNLIDGPELSVLPAFFMRDPILDILLGETAAP